MNDLTEPMEAKRCPTCKSGSKDESPHYVGAIPYRSKRGDPGREPNCPDSWHGGQLPPIPKIGFQSAPPPAPSEPMEAKRCPTCNGPIITPTGTVIGWVDQVPCVVCHGTGKLK